MYGIGLLVVSLFFTVSNELVNRYYVNVLEVCSLT